MNDPQTSEPPPFSLYDGTRQYQNFCRMPQLFAHSVMRAPKTPHVFPEGDPIALPDNYSHMGEERSTQGLIEETDTSAILVIRDGQVVLERYFLTGGRDVNWISWSVAKSFVSALIGIAIEEGHIGSINDPVCDYVPALKGSGYGGVRLVDILQMSSGVRWSEDYSDPEADVHKLGAVMAGQSTLEEFCASMVRDAEPGTLCQYNSADTQALGLVLTYATGQSLSHYMQSKLYEPLGMEADGYWMIDKAGMELALGGLNLTARDFAKIGELYRLGGKWDGKQVVSEDWVKRSTAAPQGHLEAGKVLVGGHVFPFGYGYQWWLPKSDHGEFSAIGVYNQFVFVDPSRNATIVKLSANPVYGTAPDEATNREAETVAFIRSILARLD